MPRFEYAVKDKEGKNLAGTREAATLMTSLIGFEKESISLFG